MHLGHLFKQKGYEHVVFVLRRHPFILLKSVILFVVLALLPAGVIFLLQHVNPNVLLGSISFPIVAVAGSIYYLAIWLFFFTAVLDYYLDLWIVTNDRILSIDQEGLFSRTISEVDLWRVQDVTSEVKGAVSTIFNYGNVYIQTAAEKERFVFEQVHNPNFIRQRIIELAEEDRKYHKVPAV
jgi:uncharacterized membrane protein YdbT with pleckstrin-like domain